VIKKSPKWVEALMNGSCFCYFIFCYANLHYFSPSNLPLTAGKELMLCFGFCFAREIGYLQIAHVMDEDYVPLNLPNFVIISLLIFNTSLHAWGLPLFDEYYFLLLLTFAAFLSYAHLVYFATKEITEELNIRVFSLKRKKYAARKDKDVD
jgi:hypothetical protein